MLNDILGLSICMKCFECSANDLILMIWLSQEITNFKSKLIKLYYSILNWNISNMLFCCIQSSEIAISFRKKIVLFKKKNYDFSLPTRHNELCQYHLTPWFKTVAISFLVNMHLFFISGFYSPYSVSCSALIKARFPEERSAEFLSH